MSPVKIGVVTLLPLESVEAKAVTAECDPKNFKVVIQEFLTRGDCALVLELTDGSEIGISPESDRWRVAKDQPGGASIAEQLRPTLDEGRNYVLGEN